MSMDRVDRKAKWVDIARLHRDASFVLLVATISTTIHFACGFVMLAALLIRLPRFPLLPFYVNGMLMCLLWLPVAYYVLQLAAHGSVARSSDAVIVRVCSFVPFLQIVAGIGLCRRLNMQWRKLGLEVGWSGPSEQQLAKADFDSMCAQCGYNLQGNVSGVCPECGKALVAMPS